MRKRYVFEDVPEEYSGTEILVRPFPVFHSDTDILVTDSACFLLMVEDVVQARRIRPSCRVVVMASESEEPLISALFPHVEFLADAAHPRFGSLLTGHGTWRAMDGRERLTEREETVLHALGEGMSYTEIAEKLGISTRTVRRTRENITAKTGMTRSTDFTVYSKTDSWISISGRSMAGDGV